MALVGASVIAVTPIAPPPQALAPQVHIPEVPMPAVQLTAQVIDIFRFPAARQYIVNQIDDLITLGVGLGGSAVALGNAIVAIPGVSVTVVQQILSGDLLGALDTIQTFLVGSTGAVVGPTLNAIIERRQRVLAVQSALQVAVPTAVIGLATSFGTALNGVLQASIIGGQGVVDAVLTLDLRNIATPLVDRTRLVLGSFVDGGHDIVDGIVAAQNTIAEALAAQPAASATALSGEVASAKVTDVPKLSRKTAMLTLRPQKDTTDTTKKADEDNSGTTAKSETSATADKSDHPRLKLREKDADNSGASSKHETKKAEKESASAKKK
jgi:hypothetical protein